MGRSLAGIGILAVTFVACGSESDDATPTSVAPVGVTAERCLVRLHGRTGTGGPPVVHDAYAELSPTGNDEYADGHQWLYSTEERYIGARDIVARAISGAGCEHVVLNGFSNGAAFAAKLYCRGETFGGVVAGVVVDDPVPDEAVRGCSPAPGVPVALYWTGALRDANAGVECDSIDYTCEGSVLLGIDAFADELGTEIIPSPHAEHLWYRDAPELSDWLDA